MAIEKVKFVSEDGAAVEMTIDGVVYRVQVGDALRMYGLMEWIGGGNNIEPFYTILSAEYANEEGTAIRLRTQEAGGVIAVVERTNIWHLYHDWLDTGGVVEPYVDRGAAQRAAEEEKAQVEARRIELLDAMIASGVTPESFKPLP